MMYTNAQHVQQGQKTPEDLINYSKSLHEYTLRLWTESRRKVEQQAQARAKADRASMGSPEKKAK